MSSYFLSIAKVISATAIVNLEMNDVNELVSRLIHTTSNCGNDGTSATAHTFPGC